MSIPSLTNIPIFICHAANLTVRRIALEEQIKKLSLAELFGPITWITSHDATKLAETPNIQRQLSRPEYEWNMRAAKAGYGYVQPRPLRVAELSLALKHFDIWAEIAKGECPFAVILEDDAQLEHYFCNTIYSCLVEFSSCSCVYLGSSGNSAPKIKEQSVGLKVGHPASRCTDSYLISNKAASELYNSLKYPVLPVDFDMSYGHAINFHEVWHLKNPVVTQGSQTGKYKSEIQ